MHPPNSSEIEITTFFLIGMPGLEHAHVWISVPICLMYLVAILGNCTILFVIRTEPSLHAPMYHFLSMLAVSDLGLSFSSLPTMLRIFVFNAMGISPNACFAQEFFIHGFTDMESSVLLVMSFDRFLAIRNPLRYSSILTSARVAKMGLVFLIKSMLTYCRKSLLSHSYCLHQDVRKLASCASTRVNSLYGFIVLIFTLGLDALLILMSYVLILKTVLGIASRSERLTTLSTCLSHMSAVFFFYVPFIGASVIHRYGEHLSPVVHMLMANIYVLLPAVLNPIAYSVKTKQIRRRIIQVFQRRKNRV
uniref:Olfactory receptor n=1 Tax=Piliocolobus tephrosceles TaxID=591936 RepID=A0A8C9H403_9PRIM